MQSTSVPMPPPSMEATSFMSTTMLRYFPKSFETTSHSAAASDWKTNFPPHCTIATSPIVRVVSARSTYFLLILVEVGELFLRARFWPDTLSILVVLFSFMTNMSGWTFPFLLTPE
jgi:hypothetical protein